MENLVSQVRSKPIGPRATAAWLSARGLYVPPSHNWEVTIALESAAASSPAARIDLAIDWLEWSFMFTHDNRMSWIRVLDLPEARDRDDFGLLTVTPPLRILGTLIQTIEDRFELRFRRAQAAITTNIPNSEDKIRVWTVSSL